MSFAKLVVLSSIAALALSACGGLTANPQAGSAGVSRGRGKVNDPRTNVNNHVACMRQDHLPVMLVGNTGLQIGPLPAGPTVAFQSTAGAAQAIQIAGNRADQGAEVIGSALVFPNLASDQEMSEIESCLAQGVSG